MSNFNIIIYGMSVSTDMMFAALAAALLLVSIKLVEGPKAGLAVLAGFLFAAAFFTRYSAAFVLPVPVIAIMLSGPETGKSRKVMLAGCFLLSSIVFLLPHFTLNTMMFGSPFYNENWKNLAFKLYGAKDWTKFGQSGFDGIVDVIRADPARWMTSAAGQFVRSFTSTVYYLGGKGIAGILFLAAGTVSAAMMALGKDRRKQSAVIFILLLAAGGSATFFSGVRFLLPMAGIYYAAVSGLAFRRIPARIIPYGLAVVLLAVGLFTGIGHLRLYVDAHPVGELEAARRLETAHGSDITVLGTFPFMQRYVNYRYIEAEKGAGPGDTSIESWTGRLERQIREEDAQFVIIGAPTLSSRPPGILESSWSPDNLRIVEDSGAVRVFRVDTGENSVE
jgi:4-amino-4-deoxy-L-arabinose transferase-like glycosyltransferase